MTWIEKKEHWLGDRKSGNGKRPKQDRPEETYSVSDVARLMRVSRPTVFKWLSIDEPESAVITPSEWFRLPDGHIRIRERALSRLQTLT